jgi:prepilin-type N-terminal cleavage/methylation domain-containing protein
MTTQRRGFTLVELIAVVVIVSILASLGLTRYGRIRDEATMTSMRSDLKTLAIYEELFFSTNGHYTATLPIQDQFTTAGVEVTVHEADRTGWAATAIRERLKCGIFAGDADPASAPPAVEPGVIACAEEE